MLVAKGHGRQVDGAAVGISDRVVVNGFGIEAITVL